MIRRPPRSPLFPYTPLSRSEIHTNSVNRCYCASNTPPLPSNSAKRRKDGRSEEHTSELQSHLNLVCRLLLEKKKIALAITGFKGKRSLLRSLRDQEDPSTMG